MKVDKETIEHWLEEIEIHQEKLSVWELDFFQSIIIQFKINNRSLSDRQLEILERIYAEKTP